MTERTLNPDGTQAARRFEKACQPDHRIISKQRQSDGGVFQIRRAESDPIHARPFVVHHPMSQGWPHSVNVNFQAERESGLGAHSGTDAAELCTLDGFVQLQTVAPESLIAECIEAKRLAAFVNHPLRVLDLWILRCVCALLSAHPRQH